LILHQKGTKFTFFFRLILLCSSVDSPPVQQQMRVVRWPGSAYTL